mgnify:CR=1 FL=1
MRSPSDCNFVDRLAESPTDTIISGGSKFVNETHRNDPRRSTFAVGTAAFCRRAKNGKGGVCLSAGTLGQKGDRIAISDEGDNITEVGSIKDVDPSIGSLVEVDSYPITEYSHLEIGPLDPLASEVRVGNLVFSNGAESRGTFGYVESLESNPTVIEDPSNVLTSTETMQIRILPRHRLPNHGDGGMAWFDVKQRPACLHLGHFEDGVSACVPFSKVYLLTSHVSTCDYPLIFYIRFTTDSQACVQQVYLRQFKKEREVSRNLQRERIPNLLCIPEGSLCLTCGLRSQS